MPPLSNVLTGLLTYCLRIAVGDGLNDELTRLIATVGAALQGERHTAGVNAQHLMAERQELAGLVDNIAAVADLVVSLTLEVLQHVSREWGRGGTA